MWKVSYTCETTWKRLFHGEEFHTRKAARIWCKRANKRLMLLHAPDGTEERFNPGVA